MSKLTAPAGLDSLVHARLKVVLWAGLGVLVIAGIGRSDKAPKPLSSVDIASYVADLNNDSRSIRVAALYRMAGHRPLRYQSPFGFVVHCFVRG